jgi:hypothetical protein
VTRTRGTTDVRNTQLHALLTALQQLKFYVQQAADADVENAITIIESSGMSVKRPAVRTKASCRPCCTASDTPRAFRRTSRTDARARRADPG